MSATLPIAFFAGLIGLGFGSLNANNMFLIPSISPLISSLVLMACIGIFWTQKDSIIEYQEVGIQGGLILAYGTLLGALCQWVLRSYHNSRNRHC